MHAQDVMTHNVLVAEEGWTTKQAAELLVKYGFDALPVVGPDEQLVGIVTEKDLLADPLSGRQLRRPATVGGVMTTDPWCVYPRDNVEVVRHRMRTTGVRALPVIDHGKVVGIITRRDLLRAGH